MDHDYVGKSTGFASYTPTYVQLVVYIYIKITPTCFGVNTRTPSSGSLQLC
jgi:hypothetical protein